MQKAANWFERTYLRFQCYPINVFEPHGSHATSSDVKTSCNTDNVEFMDSTILKLNALGSEPNDWVVLDIYNIDIWTIELLVILVFKTRTLDAKGMRGLEWSE
jgi:hypothetical protein